MFTEQIKLFIKVIRKIAYVLSGLFIFILIIEIIRALQTLASVHIQLGWFVGALALGWLLWGVWKIHSLFKVFPTVLEPPVSQSFGGKSTRNYYKAYVKYLKQFIEGMLQNKNLDDTTVNHLKIQLQDHKLFSINNNSEALQENIKTIDGKIIIPALMELDEKAELVVKNTVRDTMAGVMLMPFKAADIYLVIYRNGVMFFELVKIYCQRPTLGQTYRVFKDVIKMVATVNILSYTERFTQRLMANVPILDKTTDDIIQGTGAGILTTAIGKATIQRCRNYKEWLIDEQLQSYQNTTRDFFIYVKNILSEDVLPPLSKPWKQAWEYLKGMFTRDDTDFNSNIENNPKWKFWRKIGT